MCAQELYTIADWIKGINPWKYLQPSNQWHEGGGPRRQFLFESGNTMGEGSCPHKPFDLPSAWLLHKVSAAFVYNVQCRTPNTTKFVGEIVHIKAWGT